MKAKALRTANWNCNGNLYECKIGEELEIASADEDKARASGLFEEIKEAPKAKAKPKKAD